MTVPFRSKYGAKKVTVDGMTFDSKKEFNRWCELSLMERAGKISDLKRQVKFELLPNQRDPETRKVVERSCDYIADFTYHKDGKFVVEDAKGFKTKDYIVKRKLMLWIHGIRVKEV